MALELYSALGTPSIWFNGICFIRRDLVAELPEDKDKKSNATKVIKALKAFEGEHFLVQRVSEIEDKTLLKLWNDKHDSIKIGENKFDITLLDNEVEQIETEYLNNCCRENLVRQYSVDMANYICPTCGFSPKQFISGYNKA